MKTESAIFNEQKYISIPSSSYSDLIGLFLGAILVVQSVNMNRISTFAVLKSISMYRMEMDLLMSLGEKCRER